MIGEEATRRMTDVLYALGALVVLLGIGALALVIPVALAVAFYGNLREHDARAIPDPRHFRPWKCS